MLLQKINTSISMPLLFLIAFVFALTSCNNETKPTETIVKETKEIEPIKEEAAPETNVSEPIPESFKSNIRPNEELTLGQIYTDTVKFVEFNDEGDYWISGIEKKQKTIYLIQNIENTFVKGDEVEIQWKIDSIRYAGDDTYVNYREFLLAAKKLNSQQLVDKDYRILWREFLYDEELETDKYSIVLDEEYFQNISEPEKAVIAYAATFIGNECAWDGKADENRSNLKCKILTALDLGYQCSENHLGFLKQWFRSNESILKELESCPTKPDGATIQSTFDEMNIEVKGNQIILNFSVHGINIRESETWNWTETHQFELQENELILIEKIISKKEFGTLTMSEN